MIEVLYYAHADMPGAHWVEVRDAETDAVLPHVVEANALQGWIRTFRADREKHQVILMWSNPDRYFLGELLRTIWHPDFRGHRN